MLRPNFRKRPQHVFIGNQNRQERFVSKSTTLLPYLTVVTLPSQPQSLTVSGTMQYAIALAWSTPKENADTVTGYRVFYKKRNDALHYNSVSVPLSSH